MTYADAIRFLYDLQLFGAQFGLERAQRLAELAGSPQNALRFIHVAGTNGKGSVCAMLESIYRASGLRVGLYTSPHLVSFRERIQVNRQQISETNVARLAADAREWLKELPRDQHATFFEVVTVMALRYFAEQKCDLVIWETGLGGRLDATNIVTPLASVITNVQFDHEKWLGSSLAEIAREKAGIIKPRVPVITGAEEPALSVIHSKADESLAPLYPVKDIVTRHEIGLRGCHQRMNAAVALKTIEVLAPVLPVSEAQLRTGLANVSWPGRFQIFRRGPQTLILDGAHNPAGAAALAETLRAELGGIPLSFIIGILEDKNWRAVLDAFTGVAAEMIFVPVASDRSLAPARLAEEISRTRDFPVRIAANFEEALTLATNAPAVVITGSLYLVGEALERLGGDSSGERGLNNWSVSSAGSSGAP